MKKLLLNLRNGLSIMLAIALVFVTSACGTAILKDGPGSTASVLPSVGSLENLKALLEKMQGSNQDHWGFRSAMPMAEASDSNAKSGDSLADGGNDYSGTNIQVQGVDEADIVKTDGEYIYQVSQKQIIIARAYPASDLSLVNTISFEDGNYYPSEIYLDNKHLIVIGNTMRYMPMPGMDTNIPKDGVGVAPSSEMSKERLIEPNYYPYQYSQGTTRVIIYDIAQPENAKVVRDFELDGYMVSSRKIGSQLYLISNKYIHYYMPQEEMAEDMILPWYRDSAAGKEFTAVKYSDIRYFPDAQDANYLLIAGINLDKMNEKANITTYLGSGQTIYATRDNLYVAVAKWEYENNSNEAAPDRVNEPVVSVDIADEPVVAEDVADKPADTDLLPDSDDMVRILPIFQSFKVDTQIYKFALDNGKATYTAKGEVPGSLLNQFSMDEHNGYFRLATTVGDMWRNDEFTSKNNIYILDSAMNLAGKIEDIAPGERIYSVRFMGDKGYMVTFKTVDPLFVLDLKNPNQPKILGELKIPGYSDYLHPYDENHIIGFGMDAVEGELKDHNGNVYGTTAYQMGMKVAMFDVSDVHNPIEKFNVSIGDRGTYSEVLYNHKALLFSKEKDLMAFPVIVMEAREKWMEHDRSIPNYGEFAFQGVYVFGVDLINGFTLKSRISHLTPSETQQAKHRWYDYEKTVERSLYINDTFYTLSKAFIKAHSLENFEEKAELKLPFNRGY